MLILFTELPITKQDNNHIQPWLKVLSTLTFYFYLWKYLLLTFLPFNPYQKRFFKTSTHVNKNRKKQEVSERPKTDSM